jgi:hypothetical protein
VTSPPIQILNILDGMRWTGSTSTNFIDLLSGLERMPEGREWLKTNTLFLEAIRQSTAKNITNPSDNSGSLASWLTLSNRVHGALLVATGTNAVKTNDR